jgi:starvation-inducible DNA-binding protein
MPALPYQTANDLPDTSREAMVALLNQQLADAADLGLQIKHAHWNVKGPQFFSLHQLFDELAEDLEDHIDDIAERTVELGGIAAGTLQQVAATSRLAPYPSQVSTGRDHCTALSGRWHFLERPPVPR